jgi:antitoxin component HigA of HigAB toxin-antitoxin module
VVLQRGQRAEDLAAALGSTSGVSEVVLLVGKSDVEF